MNLKALDLPLLTKLASQLIDHVTCLECCKYFIAPETASCGHTLCHTCWRRRRTCPSCAAPLDKHSLKLNLPMQVRTEHFQRLAEIFEKLFEIKLDEFSLDIEIEPSSDPTKNVKDWLASSQNNFSGPLPYSDSCTQHVTSPIKLSSQKIQIHSNSKKSVSPGKVIYVQPPQDDWDKIENIPDTEETVTNKENVDLIDKCIIPLNDEEYTTENPRRSSRKRESTTREQLALTTKDTLLDNCSHKNSSLDTDKKSNNVKQNWNNVKRMKKEFSKLNKINRNKLNVSIEMCKKTQTTANKPAIETEQKKKSDNETQPHIYTIEDNTPTIEQKDKEKNIKNDNRIEITNNKCVNSGPEFVKNNNSPKNEEPASISKVDEPTKNLSSKDNVDLAPDNIYINNTSHTQVENKSSKMLFIKKSLLCPKQTREHNIHTINIDNNPETLNNDDIEITIKIGNTIANIVIKKKTNDVQLKVNTNKEVQTSLGSNSIIYKNEVISELQNDNVRNIGINMENNQNVTESGVVNSNESEKIQKSVCTKKNTTSANTETVQFEITESVEKELSNIMECEEVVNSDNVNKLESKNKMASSSKNTQSSLQNENNNNNNNESLMEDLDIFDNASLQGQRVHLLKNSKHIHSKILTPTAKNIKIKNIPNKRDRELNDENEQQITKKLKPDIDTRPDSLQKRIKDNTLENSDSISFDAAMNQIFANIDTDIQKDQQDKHLIKPAETSTQNVIESQRIQIKNTNTSLSNKLPCLKEFVIEKCSKSFFSNTNKDIDFKQRKEDVVSTVHNVDSLLTPWVCLEPIANEENNEAKTMELGTPYYEPDDDDSVVEETPQKNVSVSKKKNEMNLVRDDSDATKNINLSQVVKNTINVSDSESLKLIKDVTNVETVRKLTSETPLTINKFVDQIKHKSTPVAKKSLNFDSEIIDDFDPEQTLCPSSVVAKITQEKEFMSKAFEQTQKSPEKKTLMTKNIKVDELKFCIAGSCLAPQDLANLKLLCRKRNWKYVEKYTNELTHLVVSVDEENKSQRSVKYMCALAASKWIVSNQWVEACLKTNLVLGENHYEVLDGTGEPGPKRSRLAKKKLFEGITFFCMPPFSVLDPNILKEMLESSGGRVVNEAKAVKACSDSPALLLAEPENTQEDRFMYLALELGIVPVNYEWVLNCLGSYTLSSIHDLLLCPSALLPPSTANWPAVLISRDSE